VVFALNTVSLTLYSFESETEAIARCPGIEVAEGDWLFFSDEGYPLKPTYSIPPYVSAERGKYYDGVYSLIRSAGVGLSKIITDAHIVDECSRFNSVEEIREFLESGILPPN
jgi:hypothetical protein